MDPDSRNFSLPYRAVEQLIADLHAIDPNKTGTLRARLKHLKRLGFPDGVNTGRGVPAQYRISEIAQLLLAFELLRSGLPPERIVRLIRNAGTLIPKNFSLGTRKFQSLGSREEDLFAIINPDALSDIAVAPSSDTAYPALYFSFSCDLAVDFREDVALRTVVLINVTRLLGDADEILQSNSFIEPGEFDREIESWARTEIASRGVEPA
jgi:hypothetical protein